MNLKIVTLIKLLKYEMEVLLISIYFCETRRRTYCICSIHLLWKDIEWIHFFNLLIQTYFLFGCSAKASQMPISELYIGFKDEQDIRLTGWSYFRLLFLPKPLESIIHLMYFVTEPWQKLCEVCGMRRNANT